MMDGRITIWSPAMEQRYGFTADQALGQVSHQLLGTIYWQALDEIEAVLIDQTTWSGGLIHRRVDGQPIMTANYWHLHRDTERGEALVTEVHSDVVAAGTLAGRQLADVMTTIAHELSQPLTAISSYLTASQRDLERGWPDRERATQGMTQANAQISRATETVRLVRSLGGLLRDTKDDIAYANLPASHWLARETVQESIRIVERSRRARAESRSERDAARLRLLRHAAADADEALLKRIVVLENIVRFQRKLAHEKEAARPDRRMQRALQRSLAEEEAKLALLDREEVEHQL